MCGRRLLACPLSDHPDAALTSDAIKMAVAVHGGRAPIDVVIFHSDRGSTYTAAHFTALCRRLGIRQSMGRVGSCFDNAASEAFFSTLEHEVLSRHRFATKAQARAVVTAWCHDFYNLRRRHSSAGLCHPSNTKRSRPSNRGPHRGSLHDSGGSPIRVGLGLADRPVSLGAAVLPGDPAGKPLADLDRR